MIAALLQAVFAATACWSPPVDAPIARSFEAPPCSWCAGHRGVAFATAPGTAVRAVATGTVTFAGVVAGKRFVTVTDAAGTQVTYGYLASVVVSGGQVAVAGSVLGTTGDPLLLTVRVGGQYVDPVPMLGELRWRSRLVPATADDPRAAPPPTLSCRRPGVGPGLRRGVRPGV